MAAFTPQALTALEALARSLAHIGHHKAMDAFHAYAWRQGWHGTPTWLEARARFVRAYKQARQAYLDREARNEWRAA
jgi:hypothetical protein